MLVTLLYLAAAACHPAAAPYPPDYLRIDVDSSPMSLDPRYATDAVSARVCELMFDSLLRTDSRLKLVGDLAESYSWDSPTQLTFHLRAGVRFSDGRPLDANDVKHTYDSVLAPSSRSPKRSGIEVIAAVTAVDAVTVRISLKRPFASAPDLALLGIVPRDAAAAAGATPPGSGPFKLIDFRRDEMVVLARNPLWHQGAALPPGLAIRVVPDPTVCALELVKGTTQLSENNLPPQLLSYLQTRPGLRVMISAGTTYQYLMFNFRDPRLRDLRVRQAIAMAIDRSAIIHSLLMNTARAASGMLAPENGAYTAKVDTYRFDPAAAERLLDHAGFVRRPELGGRRFALRYKTTQGEERRLLAQALAAMLARVGIELRVQSLEWPTFYSDIGRGNFDLTSLAWVGVNDPHHYYLIFHSTMTPPRGLNRGWYASPEMDRLLERGEATFDSAARREIYVQVQKLAAKELPYVSLWWMDNVAVMDERLSGFVPYPNGDLISLAKTWIESGRRAAR